MIDLAFSVLCSSLIFVVFKLFSRYKVNTLWAIITNYLVACSCGLLLSPGYMGFAELVQKSWFLGTVFLGVLFIVIFNIMARSSQVNGVGVTSVATKMSLVIPVIFAVQYYNERLSWAQLLGIGLALIAVYLASVKKEAHQLNNSHLWLPFLVFLGSGIIDTSIKFIQESYLDKSEYPLFSSTVFGAAALSGVVFIGFTSKKDTPKLNVKSIIGGLCLGIPNYFSIFFLLRALSHDTFNSSSIFTINNVAIVLFSTLLGILLFRERLEIKNWLGVALAVISIILVALF